MWIDDAERRRDRERHGVDDRVRDVDRIDRERPHLPALARAEDVRRSTSLVEVVLAQPRGDQPAAIGVA